MPTSLILPERKITRARVIARYIITAGYPGVVVFTCGNAAYALRQVGVDVLEISEGGDLRPGDKWWKPEEVRRAFPHLFDATSGHLPAPLMVRVAMELRSEIGKLSHKHYSVPTGSGETIICLRMAYPTVRFTPVYDVGKGTEYSPDAPLNWWVGHG